MDIVTLIQTNELLSSPLTFGTLIGLATVLVWLAFRPAPAARMVSSRLENYLERPDLIVEDDMRRPFGERVLVPLLRRMLRLLGTIAPKRNLEATERMLVQAGNPGNLSVLDFFGLRVLALVLLGGGYFFLLGPSVAFSVALRNSLALGGLGFMLPLLWLRRRVRKRKHEVLRALPDALDMMTIGVEAGLAFETAMLKVGDKWDNALTRELRRAVTEMRVGTHRDLALERMAERLGVQEVSTFVTVLIQSNQLGMSIAQVLHTQADQMRIKRRQRAEELARQAGGKMVFPLVFLILPAMFIVLLGPAVPDVLYWMGRLGGGSP